MAPAKLPECEFFAETVDLNLSATHVRTDKLAMDVFFLGFSSM